MKLILIPVFNIALFSCAPMPSSAPSSSTTANRAQKTIPAVFHGTWVTRPASMDSWVKISASSVEGHEEYTKPLRVEVLEQGEAVHITGISSGEGESWETSHFFSISSDGRTLTDNGSTYYRGVKPY